MIGDHIDLMVIFWCNTALCEKIRQEKVSGNLILFTRERCLLACTLIKLVFLGTRVSQI